MARFNYAELYKDEPDYIKDKKFDADWSVWTKDNVLFVRFEGTKSVKDAAMDLLAFQSKVAAYDGADWEAHAGFKYAYYSVRNQVLDKCYELYQEGMKIMVLGHSLGGAMALLATEDIGWHFKTKVTNITWGAPRVAKGKKGVEAIKAYQDDDSINFENGSDIVPTLPWWFAANPKIVHIGEPKFNVLKGIWDVISGKLKYHCGYGNESLYEGIA